MTAGLRLALNLSAGEVCRADVAAVLAAQVERAGVPLSSIEIEITEEALLDRVSDRTLDQLAALRTRGARLILDDFGAGSACLGHLLRLPLDGLKLDRRFIQRLGADKRAEEIVRAMVSVGHGFGMTVTAEGVETAAQADHVRRLGCDAAQGFFYARPLTVPDLAAWLSADTS